METEVYLESFTEGGSPLYITVKLNIYQDETIETRFGSKLFWTYEILNIKAKVHKRYGDDMDYVDYLDDEHFSEINKACMEELETFRRTA